MKDAAGKVTGDTRLQPEGKIDKAKGAAHNTAGDVKDAARKAKKLALWPQRIAYVSDDAIPFTFFRLRITQINAMDRSTIASGKIAPGIVDLSFPGCWQRKEVRGHSLIMKGGRIDFHLGSQIAAWTVVSGVGEAVDLNFSSSIRCH
jgi:hypothetical protein